VGAHVNLTVQKVSLRSYKGDGGEQTPCGVSGYRRLRDCLGELERFVFEVKRLPNDKKDLKTAKREAQNQRKKILAAEKLFRQQHCEFSTDGEWVTAEDYQVLLC
jgi:hypothetical protein